MQSTVNSRARLLGTTVLAGLGLLLASVPAVAQEAMETVTVTGYRASLADSTNAKRESVGFSDAVFAEDIGKFPDTNIAESLNRIPGVTIQRETDGSGMRIAIRGLGTDFTRILLNNTVVATGGSGPTDAGGQNREVDLQMFPTELFTQLTVSKSQDASMIEGGAAGVVNMRTMRPFDNPGMHLTYILQGSDYTKASEFGYRGTLIGSYTEGAFGVLVGLSGQQNNVMTTGYETIGMTNLNMTAAQYGRADCSGYTYTGNASNVNYCNKTGGDNSWSLPATVPSNANIPGVAAGTTIDWALLHSLNPDVSADQLSNGIIPRLGRPMYQRGSRDRYNAVVSFEYRPTDNLHFYLDTIGSRTYNDIDRSDMDMVGRYSNLIPANMKVDQDNIITSATFYNAQFFLEARPYKEKADYISINPGFDWQVTDMLHVDGQVNWSESHFFRDSPTMLVSTPANSGMTVTYTAGAGAPPTFQTNHSLNDPANFGWPGGRVNLQQEQRYLYTKGFHANVQYGGDEMNVKAGVAYDEVYRRIRGMNNDDWYQASVCGGNPSTFLPGPNTRPTCDGVNATHPANYSSGGFGTGYTAGMAPITWKGSLVPQSAVSSYLFAGPTGFVSLDYNRFKADTNYDFYAHNAPAGVFHYPNQAPFSTGTNTNIGAGAIMEATTGYYAELNGILHRGDQKLRYNIGARWVRTHQAVTGAMSITDPRNTTLADGGKYPNQIVFPQEKRAYNALLPSASLVWEIAEDFQIRGALSRTMTRAFPGALLPNMGFGDTAAQNANYGNVKLKPYFSNNIDIGAEFYTGGEGYFGVAAFRKMITGFTVNSITPQPFSYLSAWGITYNTLAPVAQGNLAMPGRAGQTAACVATPSDATCANTTVYINQQVNVQDIQTINGVEFNWVQPLDFWLKDIGLEGFGWTANATFIRIKAPASNPNVVLGVPKFTYNVTGYYENYGASIHLSYTWNDGSAAQRSPQNNMDLVQYGAPRGQADLSMSYQLNEIFGDLPTNPQVTFDVQNLFHSKFRGYMGGQAGTYSYYNPGSVVLFGVRGTL
jgi:TonB-dependent receptor